MKGEEGKESQSLDRALWVNSLSLYLLWNIALLGRCMEVDCLDPEGQGSRFPRRNWTAPYLGGSGQHLTLALPYST
jgi:hypothetical protein